MKKMVSAVAVLLAMAMIIAGCSSGGGSTAAPGGGGGGGGTTPVTPTSNATTNAAASVSATSSIASNSGVTLSQLAAGTSMTGQAPRFRSPMAGKDTRFGKVHAVQAKMMKTVAAKKAATLNKAKRLAAGKKVSQPIPSTTVSCTDGGSVTMSGSYDDVDFSYQLTMTYATCREYDQEMNGTMTASGTFSNTSDAFSMTMGDGDGTVTTADFMTRLFTSGYVDIFATYLADMTLMGSGSCSDAACSTYTSSMSANGEETYNDFTETYTLTYNALTFDGSDTQTATGYSGSYAIGGGFSESWTGTSGAESVVITYGVTGTPVTLAWTGTDTYYEESMDGQVVTDFTPDNCSEGTFVVDTTTPVRYSFADGHTIAGRMVINTSTIIVFNASGTVTVTNGSGTTTYTSMTDIENLCPFQDFEDDTTTTDATGGGTVTATGTNLLATLSWTGSGCPTTGCTSDMDLHLDYFTETAPTSASSPAWHIYYGNQDPVDILPNDDVNTAVIYDSNYNVIGGNEGNLDFDDTEGYGPEHMTIETLTAGYYALYVDPFSLDVDTGATISVTLKIGNDAFSFPTFIFGTSDFMVHRVCDIKVEANGTVTILPPDDTLVTSYAPAMRAPKAPK